MQRSLLALISGALLSGTSAAQGSKPASIQGVWQTAQVVVTGPGARTITIPEPRPNLTILTAKHYSRVEVHAEGPRPSPADAAKATADELRAAWGPFFGEAGTYEITSGNVITMRPTVAKDAAAMTRGAFFTRTFRTQGDTLWVTDQRNERGAIANPMTAKLIRVE
jgi:hypothetical protein